MISSGRHAEFSSVLKKTFPNMLVFEWEKLLQIASVHRDAEVLSSLREVGLVERNLGEDLEGSCGRLDYFKKFRWLLAEERRAGLYNKKTNDSRESGAFRVIEWVGNFVKLEQAERGARRSWSQLRPGMVAQIEQLNRRERMHAHVRHSNENG